MAIGKGASWSRPTAVRESHGEEKDGVERLQLVGGEGLHEGVGNRLFIEGRLLVKDTNKVAVEGEYCDDPTG